MNDKNSKKFNNLKANRINEQINAKKVFVIDENGVKLGVLSIFEAMDLARSKSLDLVEVARNEFPPVCKLMDYGKHCFMMKKNQAKSKKENKTREKKEVQVRPVIEEHDFQVKLRRIIEFLEDGYKVNVILKFKGRQIVHPEIGMKVLERFIAGVEGVGKVEIKPVIEGRRANMILAPISSSGGSGSKEKAEDDNTDFELTVESTSTSDSESEE